MKKIVFFALMALTLSACQKEAVQPKVYGRFVPERKDDFAWENEYAAFRMYGPALRPENPSNGVDLWLKASPELGSCCRRCWASICTAAVSPRWTWIGGAYDRWEILEQTPEKFVFRLEYDSLLVAGHILQESITITAKANEPLNQADVVLTSDDPQAANLQLLAGGGIYMHDTIDQVSYDLFTVQYTEDALSDKTAAQMNYDFNGSTSQGRIRLTVRTPDATLTDTVDGNLVAVRPYVLGDTLTYYFGATWSEWKGPKN